MAEHNPLVWLWLLGACALVAAQTTNPLLLVTLICALMATGLFVRGPRRAVLFQAVRVAALLLMVWAGFTLVAPGEPGGDVLWARPEVSLSNGTSLGGPLTVADVSAGLVDGLRAAVVALVFGLAWQVVGGPAWHAVARTALGGLAPFLAVWCHLGDAVAATTLEAGRGRAWGLRMAPGAGETLGRAVDLAREHQHAAHPRRDPRPVFAVAAVGGLVLWPAVDSVGARVVSGLDLAFAATFVVVALGTALPGRDPAVLRWRAHNIPPLLVAVALTVVWAVREVVLTDGTVNPTAGDWSAFPLALGLGVLLVPGSVVVAAAIAEPRREGAHA